MSLSDLAAVGSIISGIAVVISFIFLALQIRQANQNQKSLMQQGRTTRNVDILLRIADPFMGEVVAQATKNCATLDPGKIWAFYGFAAAVFWAYEDSYLQVQGRTLDTSSWTSDMATIRRLLAYPAYRVVWKMARDGMSGGYRDYIDSVMRDVKPDTSRSLTDLWNIYASEEMASA